MNITSFRDLVAWQRAMLLTEKVYELTRSFPRNEEYGLSAQMRRAAVSIASNVAEGHARRTGHYLHHLNMASGSSAELQTQLELTYRLKLATKAAVDPVLADAETVGRLLHALARGVAKRHPSP